MTTTNVSRLLRLMAAGVAINGFAQITVLVWLSIAVGPWYVGAAIWVAMAAVSTIAKRLIMRKDVTT